jgi:hypothetical protein
VIGGDFNLSISARQADEGRPRRGVPGRAHREFAVIAPTTGQVGELWADVLSEWQNGNTDEKSAKIDRYFRMEDSIPHQHAQSPP